MVSSLFTLSFCAFHAVIMETLQNLFSANLGCFDPGPTIHVLRKAMSDSVQSWYLMFSNAVQNLLSSSLC